MKIDLVIVFIVLSVIFSLLGIFYISKNREVYLSGIKNILRSVIFCVIVYPGGFAAIVCALVHVFVSEVYTIYDNDKYEEGHYLFSYVDGSGVKHDISFFSTYYSNETDRELKLFSVEYSAKGSNDDSGDSGEEYIYAPRSFGELEENPRYMFSAPRKTIYEKGRGDKTVYYLDYADMVYYEFRGLIVRATEQEYRERMSRYLPKPIIGDM